MNSNECLEKFFSTLAERLYVENRLSDITWAMVETIPKFGEFLLEFFEIKKDNKIVINAFRELDGRIDLALEFGSKRFFLENKLNDRNYHIEEYCEKYKTQENIEFGILSNHILATKDLNKAIEKNWKVLYWEAFIERLNHQKGEFGEFIYLIEGYLAYAREVCNMNNISKFEFSEPSLKSLTYFNNLIKKIIKTSSNENYEYTIYSQANQRAFTNSHSGTYYYIKGKTPWARIWPFWGIDYSEEPAICFALDINFSWGDDKSNLQANMLSSIRSRNWADHEIFEFLDGKNEVNFYLKDSLYKEINGAELEVQEKKLREAFFSLNNYLEGLMQS